MLARLDRLLLVVAAVATAGAATAHLFAPPVGAFAVAALALASLATLVGRAIEQLGDRLGSGATGVVQSALGNLPELLFGVFALRQGLVTVVQATLVGSVLANVLLVAGLAMVAGGLKHGVQRFSAEPVRLMAVLLLLAVAVLVLPTLTAHVHAAASEHEQALSDVASVVLLVVFALSVPSSLGHHGEPATSPAEAWPLLVAVAVLGGAAVAAAGASEWLVTALRPAMATLGISQAFAGLVIVAIAGNAIEHLVGIRLALRDKMDYALSVTLQSPVQVALVVFPLLVLLSGVLGGAHLTLVLPPLLAVILSMATLITAFVVFDGESTWIEGACLTGLYAVMAASVWWG